MRNSIEFEVYGKLALFTNPHKCEEHSKATYPVPTYGALIGVCESLYWHPTIRWVIDEIRIMNRIRTYNMAFCGCDYYSGEQRIYENTYIYEPKYQVRAHFEWDLSRADMKKDRIEGKHYSIIKRRLNRGGFREPYLGLQECLAYVEPCVFGEGEGYYDNTGQITFGIMYHSKKYAARTGNESQPLWWEPIMQDGIIQYAKPEQCAINVA